MIVIPAMDLRGGRIVVGKDAHEYPADPVWMAGEWDREGAKMVSVIDIDASAGTGDNMETVRKIKETGIEIVLGGGIRDLERAREVAEVADKLIIGVKHLGCDKLIPALAKEIGKDRIVVAIDFRDGKGIGPDGEIDVVECINCFKSHCSSVILRDVESEFTMKGADVKFYRGMTGLGIPIIACGGVGGLDDIRALQDTGVSGVIIGNVLYERRFTLKDAIKETAF